MKCGINKNSGTTKVVKGGRRKMSLNHKTGKSSDSGPLIGSILPDVPTECKVVGTLTETELTMPRVVLFGSMHCVHCIDLLPHIEQMTKKYTNCSFALFSTGDEEDHKSMIDYFRWEFPVYSLDQSDMEAYYSVTYLPFMILTDESGKVIAKGVVYNFEEFDRIMKDNIYNPSA